MEVQVSREGRWVFNLTIIQFFLFCFVFNVGLVSSIKYNDKLIIMHQILHGSEEKDSPHEMFFFFILSDDSHNLALVNQFYIILFKSEVTIIFHHSIIFTLL